MFSLTKLRSDHNKKFRMWVILNGLIENLFNLLLIHLRLRQIISVLAFAFVTEAIFLNCTFMMGTILNTTEVYMCESTIESVGDFRTVTLIKGTHLPGRNDFDVKAISFMNQYLLNFPLNVSNFFPNLESITVFRTGLTNISRSDIENFPRLKELDLTYNDIEVISSDLFRGNLQVQALAMSLNPLRHVAHHVFDNLHELSTIDVRNTRCVNATTIDSPSTITDVVFEIFRQCPPTTQMLEEELLANDVIQRILERLDSLENPLP